MTASSNYQRISRKYPRCYTQKTVITNIKRCVVSGWHIIPLHVELESGE